MNKGTVNSNQKTGDSNMNLSILDSIFSITAIAIQILIAVLLVSLITKSNKPLIDFFARRAILFSFFIALVAMATSLFYSEIIGYAPCELCWFQRIFIYPQVILLGLALWKKDNGIVDYNIVLSSLGAAIAVYHYYGQMFNIAALPCAAPGVAVSCAQRFFVAFGYMTIPMMSLTAFLAIVIFMTARKFRNNSQPGNLN